MAIVATAIQTMRSLARLAESRESITHAQLVQNELKDVLNNMLNAETGQRGFLLSGRATYLQPYYAAISQLRESRAALAAALSDEPAAASQLGVLERAIVAKLRELDRTVRLKSEGHAEEAVDMVLTGAGKLTMDSVREAVRVLAADEDRRATQRLTEYEREIASNYWILVASVALNLLLVVVMVQRVRRAAARGEADRKVMEARNSELSELLEAGSTRNQQVHGLSELSRFLQSCVDMDEAVRLLQQGLPRLLKAETGAFYLMAASRNQVRQAFAWGGEVFTEYLDPNECWAVRLGQPFRQPPLASAAGCAHLQSEQPSAHDHIHCLPLMAHGELMGLLVLNAGAASEKVAAENEGYRRIALEQVGLSIGNLKLRESLRQQSIRDVLTGLYNRRFLEESAHREVLRATRLQEEDRHQGLALMMIDVDHFKSFNDQHGHDVGDRVLRAVAEVLLHRTRASDVVARYGGEEFTVVLADIPAAQALERAEQVRADVELLALEASGLAVGTVTISVGVAQFPVHGSTWEILLRTADHALYEAKRAGRNRVVVASQARYDPALASR